MSGCGGQSSSQEGMAPTETVYFEVSCLSAGPQCAEVKAYLEAELPKYTYAFTRRSSPEWPFFHAFELEDAVPLDSLEPPHSHLRRFLPVADPSARSKAQYLIRIELYSQTDTIPDYKVNVFSITSEEPQLIGTSDVHRAENPGHSSLSTRDIILKSVIRYSYK